MSYSSIKINKLVTGFVQLIFSLLIILQANTVFIQNGSNNQKKLLMIIYVFSFIAFLLLFRRIVNDRKLFISITIFFVSISLFLIMNSLKYTFQLEYIFIFILIPITLVSYFYFENNRFYPSSLLLNIENVIFILSLISLFFWALSLINYQTNSSMYVTWGGPREIYGYFNVHFITQGSAMVGNISIIRNTGMFVEATMFSYVLSIGLLIELFVRKSRKVNLRTAIFIITIFSTISSTGITVSILAILYYYSFIYYGEKNNKFKALNALLFLVLLFFSYLILKYNLSSKIIYSNTSSLSSYSVRMDDFHAGLKTWIQNLFIGSGIDNYGSVISNMNSLRYGINVGMSSGLMAVLSYGGVWLFSFYIIPTLSAFRINKKLIGISIFSFILFIFTISYNFVIYILILSYIFANYLKKGN